MTSCITRIGIQCGCLEAPRPPNRTVNIGHHVPPDIDVDVPQQFMSNQVITSKYTAYNFIFKNLFEQFRRIANFYFLCVGIISLIIDSPVSPVVSLLPLGFVISVTAIKQGYEDWLRHKADREVNDMVVTVLKDGQFIQALSKDIKVGDIVKVQNNEVFSCDLVLLSSTNAEGKCFVMTANLDGETNLKTAVAVQKTRNIHRDEEIDAVRGRVDCQQPVENLEEFVGNITLYDQGGDSQTTPLAIENMLLRGARMKNTDFAFGCTVYSGQETKMALNSKSKARKFSQVEVGMNRYLITFLLILVVEAAIALGVQYWFRSTDAMENGWYIPPSTRTNAGVEGIELFFSFMVLFNYIIPISLYVTVEVQKFLGSQFFAWDMEMYDEEANEPAKANTSDLNEELGQVEYLFTDKTGTLTENDMQFRQCWAGNTKYVDQEGLLCSLPNPPESGPPMGVNRIDGPLEDLLTVLVLCHTLRVEYKTATNGKANGGPNEASDAHRSADDIEYQAASPDEKAFADAAKGYGIVYRGIEDGVMEVDFSGHTRHYKLHDTLEFDATRKCMSVIIEDEDGVYWVMTKGAESSIFRKMANTPSAARDTVARQIDEYGMLGLRTLTIARRKLTADQFKDFHELILTARKSLQGREQEIQRAFEVVEQDLELVGATAIEDRLQDGVGETIVKLRQAGIKVWVLTGDKEETAVNISHSCGHFSRAMIELRLTKLTTTEEVRHLLSEHQRRVDESRGRTNPIMNENGANSDEGGEFVLVVDGTAMRFILEDLQQAFLQLCHQCSAVLCCRMSPLQKAEVVRLVKHSPAKPITAAIGDGANDCSMIMEAHVGLGVMGKEGRQAVRTSDYAFSKFRFLQRALLVHGHYYYVRISTLVQYFFYKNVTFITAQLYFSIFCGWSQQSVYDGFFLTLFNITSTGLPILIYGLQEKPVDEQKLLDNPALYKTLTRNKRMSMGEFLRWNLMGIWHSLVFFFGVYFAFDDLESSMMQSGGMYGIWAFSVILYTVIIMGVNLKLAFETYHWTWATWVAFWVTIVGYWIIIVFTNAIFWPSWAVDQQGIYGIVWVTFGSLQPWLVLVCCLMAALLPDIVYRGIVDSISHRRRSHRTAKVTTSNNNSRENSFPLRTLSVTAVEGLAYNRLNDA